MIRIIISGAAGRMGSMIRDIAQNDPEVEVTGGIEKPGHPQFPSDLKSIINKADVVIDFSSPEATIEHVKACQQAKKAIVIGTTGCSHEQIEDIKRATTDIPCVLAPNMSLAVNIMFNIASEISKQLPDYDIEIVEAHHRRKKDAPSGTAKLIAKKIATALDRSLSKTSIYGREGNTGERPQEQIGIHAVRAGDIVGEHTVIWAGPGEVLELTHRALSRMNFARGAIKAAKFVSHALPGTYSMQDVLAAK